MNGILALTTCAVLCHLAICQPEGEIFVNATAGERPDRSGWANRAKCVFFSRFSRAEIVSPSDGVPSGGVVIPQAASRPRPWLATALWKRPILVLGPTVRRPGGLRGLTGLKFRCLETKSYLTRWPARGQRYLMTIFSGRFGCLGGWQAGKGEQLPPRMSSALTDHLQIFEHHYFPGMKGLVGAPLIRGRSGHSHLRSTQRDGGNAVVMIARAAGGGKVNRQKWAIRSVRLRHSECY